MWLAAVLASALVRSTVLLTDAVPAVRGYGGGTHTRQPVKVPE
jgi:hypothetical protein